jgi:hypothetical protein
MSVSLPPHIPKLKPNKARKRAKRCHELSYLTLLHNAVENRRLIGSPWKLVQGYYQGDGCTLPFLTHHSWLACGDHVYDAVKDAYFTREEYRIRFGAVDFHEYTIKEAADEVTELGYIGVFREMGPTCVPVERAALICALPEDQEQAAAYVAFVTSATRVQEFVAKARAPYGVVV